MDLRIEIFSIQIEHFQELDEAFGLLSEQSPPPGESGFSG
jgi:hypothetical protein